MYFYGLLWVFFPKQVCKQVELSLQPCLYTVIFPSLIFNGVFSVPPVTFMRVEGKSPR